MDGYQLVQPKGVYVCVCEGGGGVVREGDKVGVSQQSPPPLLFHVVPIIDWEMRSDLNPVGSSV